MNFLIKFKILFEKHYYFILVLWANVFIQAPLLAQSPKCYTPIVMEQYWQTFPELKTKFKEENRILKFSNRWTD